MNDAKVSYVSRPGGPPVRIREYEYCSAYHAIATCSACSWKKSFSCTSIETDPGRRARRAARWHLDKSHPAKGAAA
jgi:hypothetical protein